ncbi:flagellar filament capping protein FliD [Anaerocolumna xylanovorans]|uniref:Flagellar hook-associated protein 2 n=1 Tax=Anaerocolumna xylanovorans DSM 12503 TaxID=1121345 RepID=A0A1M7Y7Z8_9FIRM|nr:flagellar filament capping protein FliD [Anaerocolumna xylanovorans]SHO48752.1 flagellar hook-associated protein 2 [Anaerocolumna xylanovorans DSM 12503]
MSIRMSGMISGLDTDSIIKELMTAKSAKKTKLEQQKTKLGWKQEKWADLNTKLYKLYTDQLSKVRLAGNYTAKKVTSSNENMVTATASSAAGSGSHTVEVKNLASAQYITGGKIDLKSTDTLVSKGVMDAGTIIRITSGAGSSATVKNLEVTADTTVADVVNTMKAAGLNASFDESQGRFFISGKNSGEANAFSIQTYTMDTSTSSALSTAADALKTAAGLTDSQVSSYRSLLEDLAKKQALYEDDSVTDKVTAWTNLQNAKQKVSDMEESFYTQAAKKIVSQNRLNDLNNAATGVGTEDIKKAYEDIKTAVQKSYYELDSDGKVKSPETFTEAAINSAKSALMKEATDNINKKMNEGTVNYATVDERNDAIKAEYERLYKDVYNYGTTEEEALKKKAEELYKNTLATAVSNAANSYTSTAEGSALVTAKAAELKLDTGATSISTATNQYKTAYTAYSNSISAPLAGKLKNLGLADTEMTTVNGKTSVTSSGGASDFILKKAADSTVILDGAELTTTGNTFTAAGITYNLVGAQAGTTVSVSVTNDSQATYDMVKNFVKAYNDILTEMNTLYNADSAKGYEPLTDDQKESMSDKQIELWEGKIKDSLLRRDDTLDSVLSTLRTSLQGSVTVNGKSYSLATLGITTGAYTEKGLLHIQGDPDDSTYSVNTNKLKEALSSDPDAVASALSGIFGKLYTSMQDKMKSSSISSALTFYNDKEMKNQVTDYTKQISAWETRLQDMEDRYYKQFSAMESALAKIQSSSKSLAGLLGS